VGGTFPLVECCYSATPRSTSPSAPIIARNARRGVDPACVGPLEGGRSDRLLASHTNTYTSREEGGPSGSSEKSLGEVSERLSSTSHSV
jgi:hypothetical protein